MNWNDLIFYPGNEELRLFTEIGILGAASGNPIHFHVEGARGTGKTTMIRAARNRLPEIERVLNCPYNCRQEKPHCPEHKNSEKPLPVERIRMPFLEISHSAKIGTVTGSIDLGRLTSPDNPQAALLPGSLPRANRGIVFVDEINRLADTSPALADVLLDAMGTKPGRVQVEETGLPTVEIPLEASVWAASNPDEEPGPLQEIRRQLSDRFDFTVRIERPDRADIVRAILRARSSGAGKPCRPLPVVNLETVQLDERVEEFLSEVYIRFRLESFRAVQAARLGAMLCAAREGRQVAGFVDLVKVLPAALRHRIEPEKVTEALNALLQAADAATHSRVEPGETRGKAGLAKSFYLPWQGFLGKYFRPSDKAMPDRGKNVDVSSREGALVLPEKKTSMPAAEKSRQR